MVRRFGRDGSRLTRLAETLDALSPLHTLRRGYAVPLAPDGHILRRVSMFEEGGAFHLRLVDGMVHCTANRSEPEERE